MIKSTQENEPKGTKENYEKWKMLGPRSDSMVQMVDAMKELTNGPGDESL